MPWNPTPGQFRLVATDIPAAPSAGPNAKVTSMTGCDTATTVTQQYPLVEMFVRSWPRNVEHTMTFAVTFDRPGSFEFLVRATMQREGGCFVTIPSAAQSLTVDQQNFPVISRRVEVQ
jgi:hypothetical protein